LKTGDFVAITKTVIRAAAALVLAAPALAQDLKLPRQKIELVAPPFVHPHEQATKHGPKVVEFRLTAEEKQIVIDDAGTKLQAMTFNGSIPAPMIVVHEDDYVEVTLVNPASNSMPHNIDFHSATGASGGGDLTLVNPGEQVVLRWKATRTGVFIYHCIPGGVGPMVPWHIASGMSGVVMVPPRDGLKDRNGKPLRYDRIYYLGEQDFYVPRDAKGRFKSYDTHIDAFADTMDVMRTLVPTHVVFNGRVGALTGRNAIRPGREPPGDARPNATSRRQFRRERKWAPRYGRKCLGMDQHMLHAQRTRCPRWSGRHDGQLRDSRGRGPSPDIYVGFHSRCARGRLLDRHATEKSRFPRRTRRRPVGRGTPAVGVGAASRRPSYPAATQLNFPVEQRIARRLGATTERFETPHGAWRRPPS
jgi:copper-containing nitrite reductase